MHEFYQSAHLPRRGTGEHQLRSLNDFIIISNQDIYPLLAAKPNNKIEK